MAKAKSNKGSGVSSAAIEQVSTASLIPYARNARTHSETQVKQIAGSIQEFGFCNPVLIDATNGIIAGHGRVLAAQLLKLETVPCLRLSHLTDAQKRAYVLADNRIALSSGWDEEMLANELSDLHADEFDMALLGFDADELTALLSMEDTAEAIGDTDAIPEVPDEPITQHGDLWILGDHRLLCGNSSDSRDVASLTNGDQWDVSIVDPPYEASSVVWLKWIMDPCIVFGTVKHLRLIPDSLWRFERVIVKRYRHRSATVQLNHKHAMVAQCGSVKKLPDDKKITLESVIDQELDTEHDHQKPVSLIVEHLTHWTPRWSTVVDPFAGSGSSIMAAEQMKKHCLAMELDPGWCDVIAKRWENATGKTAQRVANKEVEAYNMAARGADTPERPKRTKAKKEPSNV